MLEPEPPAATAAATITTIPIDADNILARTAPSIRDPRVAHREDAR
jgi:hypothetical protein